MNKSVIGKAIAAIVILAGIGVIVYAFTNKKQETTDDAQIEQYISPINVKVAGYIREIRFKEHQAVHKGDTLMIIDDREYVIALRQAEAALIDAKSGRKVVGTSVNTASSGASVYDSPSKRLSCALPNCSATTTATRISSTVRPPRSSRWSGARPN